MWCIVAAFPAEHSGFFAGPKGWVHPGDQSPRLVFASPGLAFQWAWNSAAKSLGPNGFWRVVPAGAPVVVLSR